MDEDRRVQLAVDWELVEKARKLGIDPHQAANEGLASAARDAEARANSGPREVRPETVTIHLDTNVLDYFRDKAAGDRDCESEINRVLRDYVLYQIRGRRRVPPTV